ncbi:hypothetical protein TI39_contig412g00040 [Zymoseptoria brevis]|uniref:peptidyl-tRNA hydrolase n=1 Tax=Zymoseptoria brevis TaxID=1047168 RepID=A0A0F4GMI4_9PEZI|nr:hypothetical protein TI39_contig412g00040 [Zymoseptoria brevis]
MPLMVDNQEASVLETAPAFATDSSPPPVRRSSITKPKPSTSQLQKLPKPRPPPSSTPPMPPRPLLICSIGNPGPQYANTLHSAAHTVLNRLASHLGYPSFQKDRSWGGGLLSKPPFAGGGERGNWTLWQSTAYMNDSGKGVRAALTAWKRSLPSGEGEGRLVVVHDELEKPLGAVSVKTKQGLSARGHNGLKSCAGSLGGVEWVRIGVGIGRPESRESTDVARYVLRKMDSEQKMAVEGAVEGVVEGLRRLEVG